MRGRLVACRDGKKPLSRSTRRRVDTVELPRLPVENRTVGRTFTARDGRTIRPSTLLTVTLGSHGKVHTGARTRRGRLEPCECGTLHGQRDPLLGTPLDPKAYDYRAAALDAIHFAAVLDRFWQNLRRAVGWKVQYAGAVELQKRLAPHAHFAVRGTMPRKVMRQVAAATYHQVWWPPFDIMRYTVEKASRVGLRSTVLCGSPKQAGVAVLGCRPILGAQRSPRMWCVWARSIRVGLPTARRMLSGRSGTSPSI